MYIYMYWSSTTLCLGRITHKLTHRCQAARGGAGFALFVTARRLLPLCGACGDSVEPTLVPFAAAGGAGARGAEPAEPPVRGVPSGAVAAAGVAGDLVVTEGPAAARGVVVSSSLMTTSKSRMGPETSAGGFFRLGRPAGS
jgi:hypothetical protein